jgi:hypothetical protein
MEIKVPRNPEKCTMGEKRSSTFLTPRTANREIIKQATENFTKLRQHVSNECIKLLSGNTTLRDVWNARRVRCDRGTILPLTAKAEPFHKRISGRQRTISSYTSRLRDFYLSLENTDQRIAGHIDSLTATSPKGARRRSELGYVDLERSSELAKYFVRRESPLSTPSNLYLLLNYCIDIYGALCYATLLIKRANVMEVDYHKGRRHNLYLQCIAEVWYIQLWVRQSASKWTSSS